MIAETLPFFFFPSSFLSLSVLPTSHVALVILGASTIGALLGAAGSIMLLRREALLGDSLAHCTLVGVVCAFLLTGRKDFDVLFLGALISSALGLIIIKAIQSIPLIKPDAALAVVLAGFFGLGLIGLRTVQVSALGNKAGLDSFIFGKAALMTSSDVSASLVIAIIIFIVIFITRRSLAALCFDSQGLVSLSSPIRWAQVIVALILLSAVSVALPATGIILTCSLLIIPGCIAKFVTRSFNYYVICASCMGALSGAAGTLLSFYFENVSTGASITLAATFFLLLILSLRKCRSFFRPTPRLLTVTQERS